MYYCLGIVNHTMRLISIPLMSPFKSWINTTDYPQAFSPVMNILLEKCLPGVR